MTEKEEAMENKGGRVGGKVEGHGILNFSPRPGVNVLKVTMWLSIMKLIS